MPWSCEYRNYDSDVQRHVFDWTSDGAGAATLASGVAISGQILRVSVVPSTTAAPTALYGFVLNDSDGIDVMAGQGASQPASGNADICPGVPLKDGTTTSVIPPVVHSILTLVVSAAGASKSGKVIVYVR